MEWLFPKILFENIIWVKNHWVQFEKNLQKGNNCNELFWLSYSRILNKPTFEYFNKELVCNLQISFFWKLEITYYYS